MKRRRLILSLLAAVVAVSVCTMGWRHWRLSHPDRSHVMTALTQHMRTYCVGRLLIDLPEGSNWESGATGGGVHIGDLDVSVTTGVSPAQFEELVETRWQELQAMKADLYGHPYLKPSQRIETPEKGIVFSYQFENIDSLAEDDVTPIQRLVYRAEGYVWRDGTLFKIAPGINSKDAIAKLMPRLRARQPDVIPTEPGVCLNGAFVAGYYDLNEREELIWGFDLPHQLGLVVQHTSVWGAAKSYFERDRESLAEWAGYIAAVQKNMMPGEIYEGYEFRRAERRVGEFVGDEGVAGTVKGLKRIGYQTDVSGIWDFPGRGAPSPLPWIQLQMDIPTFETSYVPSPAGGFPKPQDIPEGQDEAAFLEVWDAVVNSVRIRPGALTLPPPPTPPSSPVSREQADADRQALDDFIASRPENPPRRPKE